MFLNRRKYSGQNIFSKFLKLAIFWFSLVSCFALLVYLYEYEVKKPSKKISIEIDIDGQANVCRADPIIDRKLYERF